MLLVQAAAAQEAIEAAVARPEGKPRRVRKPSAKQGALIHLIVSLLWDWSFARLTSALSLALCKSIKAMSPFPTVSETCCLSH